jgi:hypothetical protein
MKTSLWVLTASPLHSEVFTYARTVTNVLAEYN